MTRITSARTGNGDSGYSEVLSGKVIPKSSDILIAQNYIQQLMILSSKTLLGYSKLLDKEDFDILYQLRLKECNNLSAAVYYGLNPPYDSYIPTQFNNLLLDRLDYLNNYLDKADNFIIPIDSRECDFMLLNTTVRFLEVYLWKVVFELYILPSNVPDSAKIIMSTYNTLSDYIYQLNRYVSIHHLDLTKELYWDQTK